ncbi:MAG: extracellular solute-binding protein, partial [Spirochaetota bacterium]
MAIGALSPISAAGPGKFSGKVLNIALPPGHIANFERVFKPEFEKQTGATIQLTGARSADVLARVRIEKSNPGLDLAWLDLGEAALLGKENLLVRPTQAQVPSLKEMRSTAFFEAGIAPITFYSVIGFIYNKEVVPNPPRAWKDLWDPSLKNKLALFDFGSTLGVWHLVIAAKLNGGDENNIDPGFKALQRLKPNAVSFRSSGPENNNLVAQGEAGVTFGL